MLLLFLLLSLFFVVSIFATNLRENIHKLAPLLGNEQNERSNLVIKKNNLPPPPNDGILANLQLITAADQLHLTDQFLAEIYDESAQKGQTPNLLKKHKNKIGQNKRNVTKTFNTDEDRKSILCQFDALRTEMDANGKRKFGADWKIAQHLGIPHSTICQWRKKFNWPYQKLKPYTDEDRKSILCHFDALRTEMDENGKRKFETDYKIAQHLGIHQALICQWRNNFNLPNSGKASSHQESTRANKSEVWTFFDQVPESKNAKCMECGEEVRRPYGSTDKMRRHLRRAHAKVVGNNAKNDGK